MDKGKLGWKVPSLIPARYKYYYCVHLLKKKVLFGRGPGLVVKRRDSCGQSYKHFRLVNYDSRVVIWGIFQSGMTLES